MRTHLTALPALEPATVGCLAGSVPGLIGDLRSDHAGETGAVAIYLGILSVCRDPGIRRFATGHPATERAHLARIGALLPPGEASALLPLWRVAGWLTGFLPSLIGPRAVYATIDAVETFVDHHHEAQLRKLPADGTLASGAAAFAEIWRGMPGLRWPGRLVGVPPFDALAGLGYRGFLRIRALWR